MADTRHPEFNLSQPLVCQIRVQGRLIQLWPEWFEGLAIAPEVSGETLLSSTKNSAIS